MIEADVDALAAFLVIMIFLSASPPIFTPAPLDGDAIDEVEGVAKVAVGGIWEEESEGRNVFIGLKKWCCHDHFVKGLLSWGGGDGGKREAAEDVFLRPRRKATTVVMFWSGNAPLVPCSLKTPTLTTVPQSPSPKILTT